MSFKLRIVGICGVLLMFWRCYPSSAQDERAQYPSFLSNSFIGFHIGYIDYPFSNSQMEAGFQAQAVQIPHLSARVFLFGREFNKYFSAQVSYLRPVEWIQYQNVNGDGFNHSVWMNVAGLTAKSRLPLTKTVSVYGEGGLGIITRKGFGIGPSMAIKNADYGAVLLGGGLQYRVNDNWDLLTGALFSPANAAFRQPRTSFFSGGFNYTMRPLSNEQVERNSTAGVVFAKNIVQLGYTTDALGYGVNDFVSKGAIPVFWAANVQIAHGVSVNYQRNVFHTRRLFSLDLGTGISAWKSKNNGDRFSTMSVYPILRFTAIHARPLDFYLDYSLAGPTFISRTTVDAAAIGREFTFQDFMGAGVFIGARRRINAEIRISHFSNGNLFPQNAGVTVPLTLNVGYVFQGFHHPGG